VMMLYVVKSIWKGGSVIEMRSIPNLMSVPLLPSGSERNSTCSFRR